ncbi:MAG: hypothetical protein ACR2PX_28555 [Endozoicomonas sp.]|uniref:hypothetical protein n=1 Tax=Endozoicomonas sp. TaxID=1892382 RepID=UPI003D9AB5A0
MDSTSSRSSAAGTSLLSPNKAGQNKPTSSDQNAAVVSGRHCSIASSEIAQIQSLRCSIERFIQSPSKVIPIADYAIETQSLVPYLQAVKRSLAAYSINEIPDAMPYLTDLDV